jgi:hypothetical protein
MFLPDDLVQRLRPKAIGQRGVDLGGLGHPRFDFVIGEQVRHINKIVRRQKIARWDLS